jgi:hypothetical protein
MPKDLFGASLDIEAPNSMLVKMQRSLGLPEQVQMLLFLFLVLF